MTKLRETQMAHPKELIARQHLDYLLHLVWAEYANASDEFGGEFITEADADVWTVIVKHPAIQDRLRTKRDPI